MLCAVVAALIASCVYNVTGLVGRRLPAAQRIRQAGSRQRRRRRRRRAAGALAHHGTRGAAAALLKAPTTAINQGSIAAAWSELVGGGGQAHAPSARLDGQPAPVQQSGAFNIICGLVGSRR